EAELLKMQREVEEHRQRLELDVERRVADKAKQIRNEEAKAARERYAREAEERLRTTETELAEIRGKLSDATARAGGLLKKQCEIEDRERQLVADVERRVADEARKIREEEGRAAKELYAREADEAKRTREEEMTIMRARYAREADVRVRLKDQELVEARS